MRSAHFPSNSDSGIQESVSNSAGTCAPSWQLWRLICVHPGGSPFTVRTMVILSPFASGTGQRPPRYPQCEQTVDQRRLVVFLIASSFHVMAVASDFAFLKLIPLGLAFARVSRRMPLRFAIRS